MIDMTNEHARNSIVLTTIILGLAMKINVGMELTGKITSLSAAKRNGFTNKNTQHGALLDCLALMIANNPDWDIPTSVEEALTKKFGEQMENKITQVYAEAARIVHSQ